MVDGFIQLPGDSTGKKIDTSDLEVGGSTSVHRERYVAADPSSATGLATVTSSGGLNVHVTNPSTAVTVTGSVTVNLSTAVTVTNISTAVTLTNPSTAVTITNPSTQVNTLSSGPVLIGGTVNVVSASSGAVQISGTPTVVLSSPTSLSSGIVSLSSTPTVQPVASLSSSRLVIATTMSKISSSPGVLYGLVALSTAVAAAGAYLRLYDLSTNNATSSSNAGLAGACALVRISSSVASMPYEEAYYWPQGIKFATACSFDIVLNATSTASQIGGWVTAHYSS